LAQGRTVAVRTPSRLALRTASFVDHSREKGVLSRPL
jgi:hypothetical protein